MSSQAIFLPLIKGLAIGSTFLSAGGFGVVTLMTIPAFQTTVADSHLIAAKQFATIYSIGRATQPPSTLLISCMHAYVAYHSYRTGLRTWRLWAISSALVATILPWTFKLMEPTSHELLKIAHVEPKATTDVSMNEEVEAERTGQFLQTWTHLNSVRGVLAVGAGALGVWAVLA